MEEGKENIMGNQLNTERLFTFLGIIAVTAIVWNLPTDTFGTDGLTVIQQRIIAIFVFATLSWITEAAPSWAIPLAIATAMRLTVSNNSLSMFKGEGNEVFDTLLKSKEIVATFINPVIILFLGGSILAITATKSGLDILLARNLIKPLRCKSENVLLELLLITSVFFMFVSNTAATATILTFLTPVFVAPPPNGKGCIALTMSIPVTANPGGVTTPIDTPPNAIVLQALNDLEGLNMGIGFGNWMVFMFPLVIILLFTSWRITLKFFPFTQKTIELEIKGHIHGEWCMWVVGETLILAIPLWLIPGKIIGMDSNTVAMILMGIFAITGVITSKDLQEINRSVIWMVADEFALGLGMNRSGLADRAIKSIPFKEFNPVIIPTLSGLICYLLLSFISDAITAVLLVPTLSVVCAGVGDILNSTGGTSTTLIDTAIAASSAMCLPISTSPNTTAYSTGLVRQNDMLKVGSTVSVISMILGCTLLFFIGEIHLL